MKKLFKNIVLFCLLFLSPTASAISFELQVPMTAKDAGVTTLQHRSLADGHFQTSVNSLDENGYAYAPEQMAQGRHYAPGGPRRTERDEDPNPSDPPGMDTPVGDTPWILMALLALCYLTFISFRATSRTRALHSVVQ